MKKKKSLGGFVLNPIKSSTSAILKAYRGQLWLISILMGVLIFVLNVFLAGAFYGNTLNDRMKDKLGVYVYLNDIASGEKDAVAIKTELEERGLKVDYTSKKAALGFVEKRVPELTETFKKYNLDNPLPSTLYIKYADKEEFYEMKEVLEKNKDKILNMSDVSDNAIKMQETRVLTVINLSNFLQSFAYFVVCSILLIIIVFALFFLRTIFSHFSGDIQAKKLLGATGSQIIQPFINVIFISLVLAFIFAFILLIISVVPLVGYMKALLNVSVIEHIYSMGLEILGIGVIEILFVMVLLMIISYRYVSNLHKKLK